MSKPYLVSPMPRRHLALEQFMRENGFEPGDELINTTGGEAAAEAAHHHRAEATPPKSRKLPDAKTVVFPTGSTVSVRRDRLDVLRIEVRDSNNRLLFNSEAVWQGWSTLKTARQHAETFAAEHKLTFIGLIKELREPT